MPAKRLPVWAMVVLSLLLFVIFAVAGRGATGRRPANPAMVSVTKDHLVNEIPLSSVYTLLYAIREARSNQDGGAAYGVMEEAEALQIVKREMGVPAEQFVDPALPTMRKQIASIQRAKPLNFVIVLEESLGAEFVGSLGGLALTPNLDALAKEGIWFDNLYATGTRSVRGIEAVVAGFPPTSVEATVKQPKSQRGFFTLASALKAQGYSTTFFYGGESHFDNMRSFFMGNGFERVIEKRDMAEAKFVGTWGASDGDLFDRAHREFSQAPAGKPSMSLIFTSSNHSPFEFPDGQIQLHEQPKATVNNAVKYADHALGRFIASAKASPYWENTVFLIVADHNSRVYGHSIFPVSRFHIPALLIGGPVKPQRISTLASQLDLGPTVLSLLGINSTHPMTGRDLLDPKQRDRGGRSIMQFDQVQAYREGERMVLLQPNGAPRAAKLTNQEWTQKPEIPPDLLKKALAHAWYAKLAYSNRWHAEQPSR
jgi:phosphoglycerol transferase MdoB-like AlkP superfamily enzyme